MIRKTSAVFVFAGILSLSGLIVPLQSTAGVSINVTIPLPGLVLEAPPALIVIPGTYAYYPPEVGVDIFFYQGYWYRPYQGGWYIGRDYNGPWRGIGRDRVPRTLRTLPPDYRRMPPGHRPLPYNEVRSNWRTWERDRHWDDGYDRGRGRGMEGYEGRGGRGHGHGRERGDRRRGDD